MCSPLNLVLLFSLLDPEVSFLATQLGDDAWVVREKASAALAKMDERPIKILRFYQISGDAEVRRRANRIVEAYERRVVFNENKKMPWIDHLPEHFPDRQEIINKYLLPYKESHRYDSEGHYQVFRDATADFILDYCKKGHLKKEIVELLEEMAENEKQWLSFNTNGGKNFYKRMPEE